MQVLSSKNCCIPSERYRYIEGGTTGLLTSLSQRGNQVNPFQSKGYDNTSASFPKLFEVAEIGQLHNT